MDKFQNILVNTLVTIVIVGIATLFVSGIIALTIKLWNFIL